MMQLIQLIMTLLSIMYRCYAAIIIDLCSHCIARGSCRILWALITRHQSHFCCKNNGDNQVKFIYPISNSLNINLFHHKPVSITTLLRSHHVLLPPPSCCSQLKNSMMDTLVTDKPVGECFWGRQPAECWALVLLFTLCRSSELFL